MKNFADKKLLEISANAFASEERLVAYLAEYASAFDKSWWGIATRARKYINYVQENHKPTLLESFIREYGIASEKGKALMCLAEALLRIPDIATIDALIKDKISNINWDGDNNRLSAVGFASKALRAGSFISGLRGQYKSPAGVMGELAGQVGAPIIRSAMKHAIRTAGAQFVFENSIERAIKRSENLPGYIFSYDILGEGARSEKQAWKFFTGYLDAINAIGKNIGKASLYGNPGISVKISALHPRYELTKLEILKEKLLPRLKELVTRAMNFGIEVTIDAEESRRLELSLILFRDLISDSAFVGYEGLGLAVQAYQKRAFDVLNYLKDIADSMSRQIPVRLVKGAYWDSEIKKAQQDGLTDFPIFTKKEHTDISYLACAKILLENRDYFYPQFATHNAVTISSILETAGKKGDSFEFQCLYGMGRVLYDYLKENENIKCRIYAPVGSYEDLLPYLIRRILENGSNSSFVNIIGKKDKNIDEILENPFSVLSDAVRQLVRKPVDIFNGRLNSRGIDAGNVSDLGKIENIISHNKLWDAAPLISGRKSGEEEVNRFNPADKTRNIGVAYQADEQSCRKSLVEAEEAFPSWNNLGAVRRTEILNKLADLFEENRDELIRLCVNEAGKTFSNAIAEIREAVDFCRFYAMEAIRIMGRPQILEGYVGETNEVTIEGRGVFIAISPWNFPLAIFTGQVVAALAAGNCVIAKPAEQTPLIAYKAVSLMHKAGVPEDVLHLIIGKGSIIGRELVSSEKIAGVVFTGSTETAQIINRTLAARKNGIIPFIAETGGQNCMIVDSSALPEHVVDDILISAFDSAGQRCSALRVCYVQEEIYDELVNLLSDAVQEIIVGNPSSINVDVGPVIDGDAKERLRKHIMKMKSEARFIAAAPLPSGVEKAGYFVAPHIFEIESISQLEEEVFGPILHLRKFKLRELNEVIEEINSTGYGLTFGIHSRIDRRIKYVTERIKAGNLYVNRSMIGAVVGLQPFGGEGLSGTGPKAGGANYLMRFCKEKCVSVNIAAIGGNLELLG